jgi:hypothetical protein
VTTDQTKKWYQFMRNIAFLNSLKMEAVCASKGLILLPRLQHDIVAHKTTICPYYIYFVVASWRDWCRLCVKKL